MRTQFFVSVFALIVGHMHERGIQNHMVEIEVVRYEIEQPMRYSFICSLPLPSFGIPKRPSIFAHLCRTALRTPAPPTTMRQVPFQVIKLGISPPLYVPYSPSPLLSSRSAPTFAHLCRTILPTPAPPTTMRQVPFQVIKLGISPPPYMFPTPSSLYVIPKSPHLRPSLPHCFPYLLTPPPCDKFLSKSSS
jgi:hypothetical protein